MGQLAFPRTWLLVGNTRDTHTDFIGWGCICLAAGGISTTHSQWHMQPCTDTRGDLTWGRAWMCRKGANSFPVPALP